MTIAPPPPIAFTTPWPGGPAAEKEYDRQVEAAGARNTLPLGVEHWLSPEDLQISGWLGAKWKAWPDRITTVPAPLPMQQFAVSVRGQGACRPDMMAWNFTYVSTELDASRRWFENHHCPFVFALVSWTGSIHIAPGWMLAPGRPGVYPMDGYWLVNALEAGLPLLTDVLGRGLPYPPA